MVLAFAPPGRYNTRPAVKASTQAHRERAWVEVDLTRLVQNARTAIAAARGARLLPMVKANAYGLGATAVVRALEPLEPWGYGVATTAEAVELRAAGVSRPIVVFTPARAELEATYREHDLRAVLDDPQLAARWPLPFHLEIDTGMGRAGIRWDASERLAAAASPRLEGVFTHFHSADTDPASVRAQWTRFETAMRSVPRPALVHAANSAGVWRLEQRLDLVRPGVFLYGGRAGVGLPEPAPVATLRARVVSTRRVPAGEPVSYGAEWRAPSETCVATLGIGYADGVPRAVAGRAKVVLGGRRVPLVGRVTMDMLMVDAGPVPEHAPRVGDVATLFGGDGPEVVALDEFAGWAGTISYETLTRLGPRVPRVYR
jgi:alanine racemase